MSIERVPNETRLETVLLLTGAGRQFHGYDIPPQEVAELYKLYTQTGGPSWTDHTNWFENKQCATWYGLTVAGGRVTKIELESNGLNGTYFAKPSVLLGLISWLFNSNPGLSVRYSLAGLPPAIIYVRTANSSTIADGVVSDLGVSQQQLDVSYSQSAITGALSSLRTAMRYFNTINSKSIITGGSTPMVDVAVIALSLGSAVMSQAAKDSIIERIYADRALFTNAAHTLYISGGPALTGVYQAANPPTTPAEKAFSLVNDNLGEGFLKWTLTL